MPDESSQVGRIPPERSVGESLRRAAERLIRRLRAASAPRRDESGRGDVRSQQDLAETAMAMLTLWATFEESETDHVASTTRSLVSDLTGEEMGYLVLHLAGVSRGVLHVVAGQDRPDVPAALQTVARGVHSRGVTE